MRLIVAALVLVLTACSTHAPTVAEPWTQTYRQVVLSVRKLDITTPSGVGGHCTIVRVEGLYLTAAHCVMHPGNVFRVDGVPFAVMHTRHDVAQLWPSQPIALWPSLKLARELVKGEPVAVVGYAMNAVTPTFSAGHVVTPLDEGLDRQFGVLPSAYFTVPVWPGNSGGPVVNAKGEVVSIVHGRYSFFGGFWIAQGARLDDLVAMVQ